MPGITKARIEEIRATARQILQEQGGVMAVDELATAVRKATLVLMNKTLAHNRIIVIIVGQISQI